MGTNFYHENLPCAACGRDGERRHIGKSSGGWVFALHVYPDEGIRDLPDWVERWNAPNTRIVNEYGEVKTPDQMLLTILARFGSPKNSNLTQGWKNENGAVDGPYGLARSRVSGLGCMAHGAGTYDLHDGDFS